jgi:hypothetical protein
MKTVAGSCSAPSILRLFLLPRCRQGGSPRQGYEIADDRGPIASSIGKADQPTGRLAFNMQVGYAFDADLLDRLRHDRHSEPGRHHMDDRHGLRRFLAKLGTEPGPMAARDDGVVQAGSDCPREQDHKLRRERHKRHGTIAGMAMRIRQHDHHWLVDHRLDQEPFPIDYRRAHEGDVDLAAPQACDQSRGVALLRQEDDIGIAVAVCPNDTDNKRMNIGRSSEAKLDAPCRTARVILRASLGPLNLVEDPARLVEQESPGLGEFDATLEATEERGTYLSLKMADLQAEGRLLDAEAFRCAGKMQLFGDRDEIAEMPKLHGSYDPRRSAWRAAPPSPSREVRPHFERRG